MTGTGTVLFEARHIRKTFPGVQALAGVDFDVRPGEIHALLGVNGAGKSTLVKVISGAYAPDAGEMVLRGQRFAPRSTTEAIQRGVAVVYQERTLIPSLTAAQNVLLGVEPTHLGVLDERRALLLAREIAERLGVDLDLSQEVRKLGAGERQIVDILRVLRGNPALIILDEPTAALTRRETDRLFALLRGFRERGMGVVFVSHRLDEVFAICDRATVLRDGRVVATAPLAELTKRDVVRLMVSEDVATVSTPACGATVDGEVLLQLVGLSGQGFQSVDVEVRRGEVVGLAGAVGAGCTALLETIVGFRQPSGGRIVHRGHGVRLASPADAAARGIVLLPEKRSEKGLIERLSVRVNLALPSLRRFSRL
ncbi:MAG TPA: sugar ABC transporter ATP-binding protein, partial [Chloroflexota bacterium]